MKLWRKTNQTEVLAYTRKAGKLKATIIHSIDGWVVHLEDKHGETISRRVGVKGASHHKMAKREVNKYLRRIAAEVRA